MRQRRRIQTHPVALGRFPDDLFVALVTVADQVPLLCENRVLVHEKPMCLTGTWAWGWTHSSTHRACIRGRIQGADAVLFVNGCSTHLYVDEVGLDTSRWSTRIRRELWRLGEVCRRCKRGWNEPNDRWYKTTSGERASLVE